MINLFNIKILNIIGNSFFVEFCKNIQLKPTDS